jgi:type IV pilus assembly protein PilY1
VALLLMAPVKPADAQLPPDDCANAGLDGTTGSGPCAPGGASTLPVPLADQPLLTPDVPGNLALALSVEFPTAVSVAHIGAYSTASTYLGYFDPNKCYLYSFSTTETNRHFYPAGAASNRACTGANDNMWSGNFLNWATMQTIDPFRWALTGGYRVRDTASETWLEKAWASGQGGAGNFPNRSISGANLVKGATPFTWNTLNMRIQGLGNRMRFSGTGNVNNAPTAHNPSASTNQSGVYEVSVRVKVCDPLTTPEPNCKHYGGLNWKPEGLLQQYAHKIRYSAFGYLNDGNIQRDAGVLRARQKFVGPTVPVAGASPLANTGAEWSATDGTFYTNPDPADASATASETGVTVNNSGVINYLNKFGQINPGTYKTFDPVGELYYAATRYFKNLGNVPAWSNMGGANTATKTTWVDGFPVITNWDDPILYSCQRNFILGIGDVNTHADKNLPGNGTPTGNEPTKPAQVVADTTVNTVTATNKVGELEGLGASLGTTNPYNGCCNNNSALMAGLAYDSNTRDIRPDDVNKPQTLGKQTIQTYWLDVLEYQNYKRTNQFYLATKYGGFEAPAGFDPYTRSTPLPQAWWSTSGEVLGDPAQPRPDNYFVASRPDTMVAGLSSAFSRIAAAIQSYTSSFSIAVPQVSVSGNASYASKYDTAAWTGELEAAQVGFDTATGEPTLTMAWRLSDKLATQLAGDGWNTGRRVITWNPSAAAGKPFRSGVGNLTSTQSSALDTPYRSGDDSADYINYLRGQRLHETTSSDPASSRAYRARTKLLGDIVGSRVLVVGTPSSPFSESTNPGYAQFRSDTASRKTMLYFGANDGMLHAIDGSLTGSTAGQEVFAYVPNAVIGGPSGTPAVDGLAALGNPAFSHRYFVNATPAAFDLDFGATHGGTGQLWRTLLVGGLGKGGRSVYAIDISNPPLFTTENDLAGKVLWEFTDPDLGFTFGEPLVIKTRRYGWVVVFGSGYNNPDGKGYLFVVNPRNGALIQKIGTGAGDTASPAGLAHVNSFVLDRTSGISDAVYAGDLLGNVWRFDVSPTTGTFSAPVNLATLTDSAGNRQPVTTRPMIEVHPKDRARYVLIGTGRLLHGIDLPSTQIQSFYSIKDGTGFMFQSSAGLPVGVSFPITRSNLAINADTLVGVTPTATQMGWVLDLGSGPGSIGWRVLLDPAPFYGVIAFASSLTMSNDACNASGESRIYGLDMTNGKSVLTTTVTEGGNVATVVTRYYSGMGGRLTDLKFVSVNGRVRLVGGNDQGTTQSVPGSFGATTSWRILNWREVPIPD